MTKFYVDRGGTFTDIVAITQNLVVAKRCREDRRFSCFPLPQGQTVILYKLLSENPERYPDAVIQGIRDILGLSADEPISPSLVKAVKMGTTVATNALLERKGEPVLLVITQGLGDALQIGYQDRPDLFALQIHKPSPLYAQVVEVEERLDAAGHVLVPLNLAQAEQALRTAYVQGLRSCAIVLMHAYRYPAHELALAELARQIGFEQISLSSEVSPLIKLVYRGDTTAVDAYLSPILKRYVQQVQGQLPGVSLQFMQSHGGLIDAPHFRGKDSILSGPAGGLVGAVKTAQRAGFEKMISFDMGGTSTDVAHFSGEYERLWETEIAGVRMRVPSLAIHTVAAGGGSILHFDGQRYQVGPDSAGANPGPASYRRGGPLTVTDANVLLGRLQTDYFPALFGPQANLPLDAAIVRTQFEQLAQTIQQATGLATSPESVAEGFLAIAIENMANAIKKISLQRGYDVSDYVLCCFGGAGGQVVCRLADSLGMARILIHPYAGVLSAYGMGLAEQRVLTAMTIEAPLTATLLTSLQSAYQQLEQRTLPDGLPPQANGEQMIQQIELKYEGTDTSLGLDFVPDLAHLQQKFSQLHQQRYGFLQADKALWVAAITVERIERLDCPPEPIWQDLGKSAEPIEQVPFYDQGRWQTAPVYQRDQLQSEQTIIGPALIVEGTSTIVIEVGWQARLGSPLENQPQPCYLLLEKCSPVPPAISPASSATQAGHCDPVRLEIFSNLYQFIAEQMGIILQQTAASVNIKERLDFSCAIFDQKGDLVANAPHIPVHLGSMSESVKALLTDPKVTLQPGNVYLSNNPYNGGTHLPDVTVITPMFDAQGETILFYLASRGHQADIGGISPGSMPAHSQDIREEGILFDNVLLVQQGEFQEIAIRQLLNTGPYPARNPEQNIADFKAQIAANNRGQLALRQMVEQYGLSLVQAYMGHGQDYAETCVRQALGRLRSGAFRVELDNGLQIQVRITVDSQRREAVIDFTGTSPQGAHNFNTPRAVVQAVVLYVIRTLVAENIPLNAGCLKPLHLIIPEGSLLNPQFPAAVVAGNVETSQALANALYGALGRLAASQGTMNNLSFGNENYQYYETIAGGSGAGPDFAGTDAVQTHMTNSRITDPEILEARFPVILEQFAIRPQSGGTGQYPGGNGVIRQLRFREAMQVSLLSNNRRVVPFGLAGGQPGQVGQNQVIRANGEIQALEGCSQVALQAGDRLRISTPGGGGYGAR
ncbi:hydantoinase B/oxoprolinase family protein [Synechocystis sp. LKSZ1]|uniref:hydantoinase B/oxoprolinase family protein n=1 Tax=Synechocystis sp. LKSZ1 TaxID=3144951 RepID=UPI00336C276B